MAAKLNHCAETQHLLGGSSFKLTLRQAGAHRLVSDVSIKVFCPIVPAKFRKEFFCICTAFPTLGGWPLDILCLLGLSGAASPMTSPAGQNPAVTASGARSTATPACYRSPSPFPSSSLPISPLTWWALYKTVVVATTFLRSLIALPSG
jgi:hypothetical protein